MIKISKKQRKKNIANFDKTGWKQHNGFHFSRMFNGKKLDYYPSTSRYIYDGKSVIGCVYEFMGISKKDTPDQSFDFQKLGTIKNGVVRANLKEISLHDSNIKVIWFNKTVGFYYITNHGDLLIDNLMMQTEKEAELMCIACKAIIEVYKLRKSTQF